MQSFLVCSSLLVILYCCGQHKGIVDTKFEFHTFTTYPNVDGGSCDIL